MAHLKIQAENLRPTDDGAAVRGCVELAEAGCSDAEIQAVTGQSLETVAKYRKEANQRAMSRTAQMRRFNE